MKKLVLASLAVWGMAVVLNAAPIVRIDFPCQNFWGKMECLDELPEGVWVGERQNFYDPKKKGYTFPVFIDLAKATEFELSFKFAGTGMAQSAPELTGYADDLRKTKVESDIELVDFSVNGDRSAKLPAKFRSWLGINTFVATGANEYAPGKKSTPGQKYGPIYIFDGKTVKVHAKFKK